MTRIGVLTTLACLSFALGACADDTYRGAAIEGRIIDAVTKQPVEGAIVMADWPLEGGIHESVMGHLLVQETVTDAQGRFAFPAWGPLKAEKGRIPNYAPRITCFKPGYIYDTVSNGVRATDPPLPDPLTSIHNGKDLEMPPFTGSIEEYCKAFSISGVHLYDNSCAWQQFPRMTKALLKLEEEFSAKKLMFCGELPDAVTLQLGGRCPPPAHVFAKVLRE